MGRGPLESDTGRKNTISPSLYGHLLQIPTLFSILPYVAIDKFLQGLHWLFWLPLLLHGCVD